MDNDSLQSTLISQYKIEIEEILSECEHVYRLTIDYELLESRINELFETAKSDGLDEKTLWSLIQSRIPSFINYVNSHSLKNAHKKPTGKKVA